MNIQDLKVGDTIGLYRNHVGTIIRSGFGAISKINGYGHIIVEYYHQDDMQTVSFDKHGYERTKVGGRQLCEAKWLEEQLQDRQDHNQKQKQIRSLLKYIEGQRSGDGVYHINEEQKAKLAQLVSEL